MNLTEHPADAHRRMIAELRRHPAVCDCIDREFQHWCPKAAGLAVAIARTALESDPTLEPR